MIVDVELPVVEDDLVVLIAELDGIFRLAETGSQLRGDGNVDVELLWGNLVGILDRLAVLEALGLVDEPFVDSGCEIRGGLILQATWSRSILIQREGHEIQVEGLRL